MRMTLVSNTSKQLSTLFILLCYSCTASAKLPQVRELRDNKDFNENAISISPQQVGLLHNQFINDFHQKMLDNGAPSTKEEYLELVFNETMTTFCDEEDFDCMAEQEQIFLEELADLEHDNELIESELYSVDSVIPFYMESDEQQYYRDIFSIVTRFGSSTGDINEDVKSVQKDLEKLSKDAEKKYDGSSTLRTNNKEKQEEEYRNQLRVASIQSIASVASSSLELWAWHLTTPDSIFFDLAFSSSEEYELKQILKTQGRRRLQPASFMSNFIEDNSIGDISPFTNLSLPTIPAPFSNASLPFQGQQIELHALNGTRLEGLTIDTRCVRRMVVWSTLRDVFGGIKKIKFSLIKFLILPTPFRAVKLVIKLLIGAIWGSLTVYGIDLPTKVDLLFFLLDKCCNISRPSLFGGGKNVTKLCEPVSSFL